jgi:hypothetical protein
MRPVDDAGLAEEGSRALPDVDDPRPGFDSGVARRAVENGSATTVARNPPVELGLPFRHDGRFYTKDSTSAPTHRGQG